MSGVGFAPRSGKCIRQLKIDRPPSRPFLSSSASLPPSLAFLPRPKPYFSMGRIGDKSGLLLRLLFLLAPHSLPPPSVCAAHAAAGNTYRGCKKSGPRASRILILLLSWPSLLATATAVKTLAKFNAPGCMNAAGKLKQQW